MLFPHTYSFKYTLCVYHNTVTLCYCCVTMVDNNQALLSLCIIIDAQQSLCIVIDDLQSFYIIIDDRQSFYIIIDVQQTLCINTDVQQTLFYH